MKAVIRLADSTTHGGKVVAASDSAVVNGIAVAGKGDACTCPLSGHGPCKKLTDFFLPFRIDSRIGDGMRNLNLEAAIWNLFSSEGFFEATAHECDMAKDWFGTLAVSRVAVNYGRNNQIYDFFKGLARELRRGSKLAIMGDYEYIRDVAGSIGGDIRGIMEQPLQSWMTKTEYQEFNDKVDWLLTCANKIRRVLENALVKGDTFIKPNPRCPERSNDDDGFPGDRIVKFYSSAVECYHDPLFWQLPNPLPEYVIDRSTACATGEEVPWTGVWYPGTGLEHHSLTFAIKGLKMQPAFRVTKTAEEFRAEGDLVSPPKTVAVATTWHPLIASAALPAKDETLWSKAGAPCPKAGVWQPTDPGAASRIYAVGKRWAISGRPMDLPCGAGLPLDSVKCRRPHAPCVNLEGRR